MGEVVHFKYFLKHFVILYDLSYFQSIFSASAMFYRNFWYCVGNQLMLAALKKILSPSMGQSMKTSLFCAGNRSAEGDRRKWFRFSCRYIPSGENKMKIPPAGYDVADEFLFFSGEEKLTRLISWW